MSEEDSKDNELKEEDRERASDYLSHYYEQGEKQKRKSPDWMDKVKKRIEENIAEIENDTELTPKDIRDKFEEFSVGIMKMIDEYRQEFSDNLETLKVLVGAYKRIDELTKGVDFVSLMKEHTASLEALRKLQDACKEAKVDYDKSKERYDKQYDIYVAQTVEANKLVKELNEKMLEYNNKVIELNTRLGIIGA